MSSDQAAVVETVREIVTAREPFVLTPERPWDADLWGALAQSGFTGVGIPEDAGGSGGEWSDAVAVVRTLASGVGAVPAAEHMLVAGPALVASGQTPPSMDEPLTVALSGVRAVPAETGWVLAGTAVDVPWASVAAAVAVVADVPEGSLLGVVPTAAVKITPGANLAGEPRCAVSFDGVALGSAATLTRTQVEALHARYALARAIQMAAVLDQVLAWTVQYAGERHQFGRPLARFQAIQMELAVMAGEVTAAGALVDSAAHALDRSTESYVLACAAAKIRAGAAVEVVARLAHQVHGALGFTQEHKLHHLTRRLWSWRDEAGSELYWSRILGAGLHTPDDGLWPALTRVV